MSESYPGNPAADSAQRAGGSDLTSPTKSVRGEKSGEEEGDILCKASELLRERWRLEAEVQREAVQEALAGGRWDVVVTLCRLYPFHPGVLDLVLTAAVDKRQVDAVKQLLGIGTYHTATLVTVLKFVCLREEFVSHAPEVIVQLPPTLDRPKVLGVYRSMKSCLTAVSDGKRADFEKALAVLGEYFQIDDEKHS